MLRDESLARLQEIERRGLELVERYRSLSDAARSELGAGRVDRLIETRERLLESLGDRVKAHRDLPSAGNAERAQLEALSDRILAGAAGRQRLAERLQEAERAYLETIDGVLDEPWPDADRQCLQALRAQVADAVEAWAGLV